jgi:hypothetical protein
VLGDDREETGKLSSINTDYTERKESHGFHGKQDYGASHKKDKQLREAPQPDFLSV